MKRYPIANFATLIVYLAITHPTLVSADVNHAAGDELAAAAAALAPRFDPARDAVTIQKLVSKQTAASKSKNSTTKATPQMLKLAQAVASGPSVNGSWGSVIPWTPHIPVTAALLPNGKLLTFASNQRTTFPGGNEFTYAAVWDPATGQFTEVNNLRHDMFCGGTAMLPDGRVVVNGGRNTTVLSSVYDWNTNQWSALPNMNDPRWYNPTVALPDGGIFTVSGSGGSNTAERWDPASGWRRLTGVSWSSVTSEPGYMSVWHPFLMLAPNGKLFHFGPTDTMHWVDPNGSGSLTNSGQFVPDSQYPKEGAWAMYNEGQIVVAGGGSSTTPGKDSSTGVSTTAAFKIDLRGTTPIVSSASPMTFPRQFANTVILPDGQLFVVGGNRGAKFNDIGSVLTPEIWNPVTGAWTTAANHVTPRNYHSVALLLPDGRVWSAGGGLGGNAADHPDAEIFTPPSLYTSADTLAPRPTLTTVPGRIGIGTTFTVSATPGLTRFTMIRLSSQTHSVNTDLRFLEASFTETSAGTYRLNASNNINVLTPGYWMLFGLNSSGVHSISKIFQVDQTAVVNLTAPGNQSNYTGDSVSLALSASAPTGSTLTYTASGLPAGLTMGNTTGIVSGKPTSTGTFSVTVTAATTLSTSSQTFTWTVGSISSILKFATFANSNGITLNQNAAVVAPLLRLTPASTNQVGTAFLSQSFPIKANTSFSTRLVFKESGAADGADGLALVIQGNSASQIGAGGGGLGYQGITNSLAIEFDSQAGTGDPNGNHIGVLSAGNVQTHLATHTPTFDMEDGQNHTAWVEYDGTVNTLRVYLSQIVTTVRPVTPVITLTNIDLPALVGAQAWFGFSAATGGSVNAHEITSWDLALHANRLPSLSPPPVVTALGTQTFVTDSSVSIQIQASDPDNDPLTFSATGLPAGLAIGATNGLITGLPTTTGSGTGTINVSDGINTPVATLFTWTVNPPLSLPTLGGTAIASGVSSSFTITGTGGKNVSYKWSFGDGTADTAYNSSPSANHTFASPGRYLVTVTAKDDTGRIVTSSFYQGISAPLTSLAPAASSSIITERRSTGNPRIWVVNPDSDTVAVMDAVTRAKLAEIVVPASPRTLAVAPDGRIWVACAKGGVVSIISQSSLAVVQTLAMPRGARPFGVAFDPAGTAAWLTLETTGRLLKLNPTSGAILAEVNVGPDPRHLSISHDGAQVIVSRFITPLLPGESTATIDPSGRGGELVLVNGTTATISKTIILRHSDAPDTSNSGRGIPNYLGAPVITPDGLAAWIPSKQDNIMRGILRDKQALTHDSAVRSIASRVNLTSLTEDYPSRIDFNDAGTPTAVCHDPSGIYTFVALEGSRAVVVMDTWNHVEITRFVTGRAPQGLTLSPNGNTLFVQNFMDRSVTAHDVTKIRRGEIAPPSLIGTVSTSTTEKLPAQVLLGKQHFYDTADNRLALQEYVSCASCHADAGHDGRVWDFTGVGEGLRNTITLRGQANQGALHWTGNFDEVQDFEGQIRNFAGGLGLISGGTPHPSMGTPNAGRSADLDALAAYLGSLNQTDISPARQDATTLPSTANAGRAVFISQNCASCHGGPEFTRSAVGRFENVGTIKSTTGKRLGGTLPGLDIPTLRGLWNTAPYLHDGSATTVSDAIRAHSGVILNNTDLLNLTNYILNIDESITVAPQVLSEFVETFDSNVFTSGRWVMGTPYGEVFAPIDPLVSVSQAPGKLGISPRPNSTLEGYNGIVSTGYVSLLNAAVTVEVTPAGGVSDSWIALGSATGTGNFLIIGREGSSLWIEQMVNGNRDVIDFPFNATTHKLWRIKHDQSTDQIVFQLSPDGVSWITARSVARRIDISAMRIELAGGSYRLEPQPGTALFDNVTLSSPGTLPTIASFTASPTEITTGASSTIRWSVNPGSAPLNSLTLNGANVSTSTQITVNPSQTTTYTLIATSAVGVTNSSLTLTVRPPLTSDTYAGWVSAFGGSGDLTADPDGDSYPEGLEYALALHPSNGSTQISTLAGANPAISRAIRMERVLGADGVRRFDLVFTRPVKPLTDIGYGYWLEVSQDMETWGISGNLNGAGSSSIPEILQITVTNLGDGTEEVRAGYRYLSSMFMRLAVYLPGATVRSAPFGWLTRDIHIADNLIAPPFAREVVHGGNYLWNAPKLTDTNASWTPGQWNSHFVQVTSGPAEGVMLRISGNTSNTLSFAGESVALLELLGTAPKGTFVIRPSHTLGSLFGSTEQNRQLFGSTDVATSDTVSLLNPDSSFKEYYFPTSNSGPSGWRSTTNASIDTSSTILPPTDAFYLRRKAGASTSFDSLKMFGEVILGRRIAPIRSGISLPGTWNPIEKSNLANLGLNSFFTPTPTANNNSNLYLEIGIGGGLYPHYLKTGTGWRYTDDSDLLGSKVFAPTSTWMFYRFGSEGLWFRNPAFNYTK